MLLKKSLAYIELKDKILILGLLTNYKDKFIFQTIDFINLDELDYYQDIIYNPSKILELIKNFFRENNNFNCFVSLPALDKKNDKEQKLFLLQILLILGKLNLTVKKIINKSLIKKDSGSNNQDFLLKSDIEKEQDYYKNFINLSIDNKVFFNWLRNFIISCFLLALFLIFFSSRKIDIFNNLYQENKNIENSLLDSKNSLKDLNIIKDKFNRENLFLNKFKKLNNAINIPDDYLLIISENLPEYTWLRSVKFEKNNIEINGQALGQNNISIFAQNLTKMNKFKVVNLENIEESIPEQDKLIEHLVDREVYSFKIRLLG